MYDETCRAHIINATLKVDHLSFDQQRKPSCIILILTIGVRSGSHGNNEFIITPHCDYCPTQKSPDSINPARWKHPNEKPVLLGISLSL